MRRKRSGRYVFSSRNGGALSVRASDKPGRYLNANNQYRWRPWILGHLKGERPQGHPEHITWSPNRKHPNIELDQVWVSIEGLLVTIIEVLPDDRIKYVYYRCPCSEERTVSLESFHTNFKIWDQKIAESPSVLKLARMVAQREGIRTIQEAAALFGLDPKTGIRIA